MKSIAIVGCGFVARIHAKNLKGKATLSFASKKRLSAESYNRSFGGRRAYANFDQAIEDRTLHAVVLCSPPQFHREQALKAIAHGKSVLIEKPICLNREDMLAIVEAAKKKSAGTVVMVAENFYYKPSLKRLRAMVGLGVIGTLQKIYLHKTIKATPQPWRSECGALLEGGVHFLALLTDLAESEVKSVQAEFPTYRRGAPERSSLVTVTFSNGVIGQLSYAWDVPGLTKGLFQHSRLEGTEGQVDFESNGIYARTRNANGKSFQIFPVGDISGYRTMMRDFLRALESPHQPPYATVERVAKDMEIVWSAYDLLGGDQRSELGLLSRKDSFGHLSPVQHPDQA